MPSQRQMPDMLVLYFHFRLYMHIFIRFTYSISVQNVTALNSSTPLNTDDAVGVINDCFKSVPLTRWTPTGYVSIQTKLKQS